MEAKKTKGRFIKKHDALYKVVSVTDFSLGAVAKNQPTVPDNTRANVFHHRLHSEELLAQGVHEHANLAQVFEVADKSPVLRPIDFTDDWHRLKHRYSKRRGRIDEEEELEMELEYLQGKLRPDDNGPGHTHRADEQERREQREDDNNYEERNNEPPPSADHLPLNHIVIHHENESVGMETPVQPTRNARNPVSLKDLENDESAQFTSLTDSLDPDSHKEDVYAKRDELPEIAVEAEAAAITAHPAAAEIHTEFRSLSSYMDPLAIRALSESEKDIVAEAKSRGYEDGFKLGEEKATLQIRQMYAELIDTVGELANDIASLKKNVLINAQDNFIVLCNALAQAIFKREISVDPASLSELVKRAVAEAVPDDEFKIILNPRTADALRKVLPAELSSKIRTDDSLDDGRFRLDSKLTVVDGNVGQLIADMMQQADLSLFERKDKAV